MGNSHYHNYNLSLVANNFCAFLCVVRCEYVYNHMGECTLEHMLPILGNSFEFFSLGMPDKHTQNLVSSLLVYFVYTRF